MAATFIPNPIDIAAIARFPTLAPAELEIAEKIASKARSIAPVDTGAYQRSIQATAGLEGDQVIARVYADVPYAAYIEFGTVDTPTFAPLRRGSE